MSFKIGEVNSMLGEVSSSPVELSFTMGEVSFKPGERSFTMGEVSSMLGEVSLSIIRLLPGTKSGTHTDYFPGLAQLAPETYQALSHSLVYTICNFLIFLQKILCV